MCVQLNKAFCGLCQAFEMKSATYLTNVSLLKKVIKYISDMTEIFTTEGLIQLIFEKVYLSAYYEKYKNIKNEFRLLLRFRHKKYNIFHY